MKQQLSNCKITSLNSRKNTKISRIADLRWANSTREPFFIQFIKCSRWQSLLSVLYNENKQIQKYVSKTKSIILNIKIVVKYLSALSIVKIS